MDNPEHCQSWAHEIEGAIKNGQSRDTVNFGHTRLQEQSRMDNPEHCKPWAHEIEGAIKNGQSRDTDK